MPLSNLSPLLKRIEQQLSWGESTSWHASHFDTLAERIYERTGTQLSAATLKRVWGRVKYTSAPSRTTLDTLSIFAGYPSWIDANADLARPISDAATSSPSGPTSRAWWPRTSPALLGFAGASLALLLVASLTIFRPPAATPPAEVVRFDFAPINEGLPATVQFRYTVNGGQYDSMSVQQSWNPRLRYRVDPARGFYACTYTYPGVYAAKLLLDTQVVSTKSLVVPSGGWLGTVDRSNALEPMYLRGDKLDNGKDLAAIPQHLSSAQGLDSTPVTSAIHFVSGFDSLETAKGFTLDTQFRSFGGGACMRSVLILYGVGKVLLVPFGSLGCSGDFMLIADGQRYSGKDHDLSGFGVSPTGKADANISFIDNEVLIKTASGIAFQQSLPRPFGKLLGVRWSFNGVGAVESFEIRPSGPRASL